MLTADTNLFIHAADPDSQHHPKAREFFVSLAFLEEGFVVCELVLVELYLQLRNGAIFVKPYTAQEAADYYNAMKMNPLWRCVDYDPKVSSYLWKWAAKTKAGFRQLIDARLALTLRHQARDGQCERLQVLRFRKSLGPSSHLNDNFQLVPKARQFPCSYSPLLLATRSLSGEKNDAPKFLR